MTNDPFARAAARASSSERDREPSGKGAGTGLGSWANTGFRIHLAVYFAVNLLLVVTWLLSGTSYPWFLFPLLAWGIGIAAHYAAVERWVRRR